MMVKVGKVDDFPVGTLKGIEVDGKELIIANIEGDIRALDGICTHEYTKLSTGFLMGDRVMCPLHFSQFDLRSGEALSPPAEEPLKTFQVEIKDSVVYVVME